MFGRKEEIGMRVARFIGHLVRSSGRGDTIQKACAERKEASIMVYARTAITPCMAFGGSGMQCGGTPYISFE